MKLVRLLIDRGASPTSRNYTPTDLAKKYGQERVYDLLVSKGGIPVKPKEAAQLTLIEAAQDGDYERVQAAIKNGAVIDGFDAGRQTALAAALKFSIVLPEKAVTILWLLDHGADPNVKDKDGSSPLHNFIFWNKGTLNARQGTYPKESAELILARLLKAGAKISGVDEIGRTPLHVAAKNDNMRGAELLIEAGAKVMSRDKLGKAPLDYAESAAMIKLLKQNGATEQ